MIEEKEKYYRNQELLMDTEDLINLSKEKYFLKGVEMVSCTKG
jgi:hypothetical protein